MSDTEKATDTAAKAPNEQRTSSRDFQANLTGLAPPFLHHQVISQHNCKTTKISHFAWLTAIGSVFIDSYDPNSQSSWSGPKCQKCVDEMIGPVREAFTNSVEINAIVESFFIPKNVPFTRSQLMSVRRLQNAPIMTYTFGNANDQVSEISFDLMEMKFVDYRDVKRNESREVYDLRQPRYSGPLMMAPPVGPWVPGPPQRIPDIDLSDKTINWMITTQQVDTIRSVMDNLNLLSLSHEEKSQFIQKVASDLVAKNCPYRPESNVLSVKIPEPMGTRIAVTALMECSAAIKKTDSNDDKLHFTRGVALEVLLNQEHRAVARAGVIPQGERTKEMIKKDDTH